MKLLVNQLGYEPERRKQAVVRSKDESVSAVAVRRTDDGAVVTRCEPERAGQVADWADWTFWTVDFSDVREPGRYVLTTSKGDVVSEPFRIESSLLVDELVSDVLWYCKTQRATGVYETADRTAPFVDDRDETVDVHGGWHDASGDMSKHLSHLNYANVMNPQQTPILVWGLLDAYDRAQREGLPKFLDERFRDEALYGADFLLRMLDDDGYFYISVYAPFPNEPDEREICTFGPPAEGTVTSGDTTQLAKTDDYEAGFRQGGGVAIAALARASDLDGPSAFGSDDHLDGAIRAFDHLQAHNETYLNDGTENLIDDYCALLAASELLAATGTDRFREAAEDRAAKVLDRQVTDGPHAGHWLVDGERPFFHAAEEGLPVVALLRYLTVRDGGPHRTAIERAVDRFWTFELAITADVPNPFGYARQYVQGLDDEPRDAFFMPHDNESGYWWQGENARIASLATAALRSCQRLPERDAELTAFAHDQLDWILGRNPFDVSMVEGIGANPPPFNPVAPNAAGGVINGITAHPENEDDIAFRPAPDTGGENSWRWGEQWLPHAAWFLQAVSWL